MELKAIETEYNGYRFRSRLEARWAVFFDALGVEYEYEPEGFELEDGTKYLPDFKVKCYGTRGEIYQIPFDLFVEVKGKMSNEDARKINTFWKSLKNEESGCSSMDIIVKFGSLAADKDDDGGKSWTCGCGITFGKVDYTKDDLNYPKEARCPYGNIDILKCIESKNMSKRQGIIIVGNIPEKDNEFDLKKSYRYGIGIDDYVDYYSLTLIDGDDWGAYPCATEEGKLYLLGDNYKQKEGKYKTIAAYNVARKARFEHGETPNKKAVRFQYEKEFGLLFDKIVDERKIDETDVNKNIQWLRQQAIDRKQRMANIK